MGLADVEVFQRNPIAIGGGVAVNDALHWRWPEQYLDPLVKLRVLEDAE